jgi:hypothetical protein
VGACVRLSNGCKELNVQGQLYLHELLPAGVAVPKKCWDKQATGIAQAVYSENN